VVIEMAHVLLVEHGVGVSFVVDQQPVGAFGADALSAANCWTGDYGRRPEHHEAMVLWATLAPS
jgi:hypothetical protein